MSTNDLENLKKHQGQKVLERTYGIRNDGCLTAEENIGDNQISLRMDANNTLMISSLQIREISIEIMMKAMLMAHTEFLTNYVMPKFTSELETRDEGGVIDRISNLPGRGVTREPNKDDNKQAVIGIAAAVAAVAASGAASVASEAATAAATAAAAAKTVVELSAE